MHTKIIRPVSFAVSFAIHALVFLNMTSFQVSAQNPHKNDIVMKVSFKKIAPPPEKKTEEVEKKIKPEPKKKALEVAKKVKPKPLPVRKSLPATKPKPKLKPVPVAKLKPEPKFLQVAIAQEKTPPITTAKAIVQKTTLPDAGQIMRERDEYLSMILSCIEKEKFYPRSARRRGIQADVDVRFTILSNGNVENIHIGASHTILKRAAKEALLNASPLPRPPKSISGAMNVEYKMEFALK